MKTLQERFGTAHRDNPVVFFDIAIQGKLKGRVKFELYAHLLPKTAENFRQFCTGEFQMGGRPVGYKGCPFHRIIKGFMLQGGDFISQDGQGQVSIYGKEFADEGLNLLHDQPGLLSMANRGPDSNGCQFFVTCGAAEWLDGKHVVFGRVLDVESMEIIRQIEEMKTNKKDQPLEAVVIVESGEY